jgi:small-conductance mechanosensitive channel
LKRGEQLDLMVFKIKLSKNRLLNAAVLSRIRALVCSTMVVLFCLTSTHCLAAVPKVFAERQDLPSAVENGAPSEIDSSKIKLKIDEIKKRLAAAKAAENEQTTNQLGITVSQLHDAVLKLQDLETVYQSLITALKKKTLLEKDADLLQKELPDRQKIGLLEKPPYSLSFYDNILDQLAGVDHKKETAELEKSLANKALENARSSLDEAQQLLRKTKEKMRVKRSDPEALRLNWEMGQAELELEFAQAVFDVRSVMKQNLSIEARLAIQEADFVQQNFARVRKHLGFDEADLNKKLQAFGETRSALQKQLKKQLQGEVRVEGLWLQAQENLMNAKGEVETALAKAALETNKARRVAAQEHLEQTEDMLRLLNQQEQAWKNRYAMVKGDVKTDQLDTWFKDFELHKVNVERKVRIQESNQNNLQAQIAVLVKQISDQDMDPRVRREFENRLQILKTLGDDGLEYLSMLTATLKMHQRFLNEIAARQEYTNLWKMLSGLTSNVKEFWNLELWVIDGNGVTVQKLVVALFMLIIGLVFVKRIVLMVARRLLFRSHLKETTAAAGEKIINYFTVLLIVLFALRVVNIPLTIFTFLGGAIAIGVGFGAQNLINNFISGFIIMAEQPIKIGDLIDIEGNFAMVEEIGARCTRIRTSGNVQILVPNSSFLEKNIVNWTHSDKEVRGKVTVGVIYGSPVRDVERIMLEVAAEHKKVKKRPEPFVLFNDFGDNALIFDLYFWINMSRIMDRRIIESDIRFHLDQRFREAEIVVAFPQRDLHLDTQRPLEFRMVNAESRPEVKEERAIDKETGPSE